jgi:hypothetical protein
MDYNKKEKIDNKKPKIFSSGAQSVILVQYELVPRIGLIRVANRFTLGLQHHGEHTYNALHKPEALKDKEWLIERASHAIGHLYNVIGKLSGQIPLGGDDDAAAVGWAGLVLAEAMEGFENEIRRNSKKDRSKHE